MRGTLKYNFSSYISSAWPFYQEIKIPLIYSRALCHSRPMIFLFFYFFLQIITNLQYAANLRFEPFPLNFLSTLYMEMCQFSYKAFSGPSHSYSSFNLVHQNVGAIKKMQGRLSGWLAKHELVHRSLGFDY